MGANKGDRIRILFMLFLTSSFFLIEITVGYITNSMALVADSFHMLSDVVALVIAYVSVRMSPKKWSKNTFGWARAEVLGALVNAVFLCALCFSILVESVKRFYKPETIHDAKLILIVGTAGLLVNVIGLFLFKDQGHHGHSHGGGHSHDHHAQDDQEDDSYRVEGALPPSSNSPKLEFPVKDEKKANEIEDENKKQVEKRQKREMKKKQSSSSQMNMKGVFLHVMADALGSVIVIISALIIEFTEWEYKDYVDPLLSVIMVCLIMYSTWPLLIESAMILLQTVPTHIQVDSLEKKLLQEIEGVLEVHEFHVWQLAGDRIIASAHIRCHNLHEYMQIAEKVKEFFHNEGIHSTTIQPEFIDLEHEYQKDNKEANCVLDCPERLSCAAQTCCGLQNDGKGEPAKIITLNGIYRATITDSRSSSPMLMRRVTVSRSCSVGLNLDGPMGLVMGNMDVLNNSRDSTV